MKRTKIHKTSTKVIRYRLKTNSVRTKRIKSRRPPHTPPKSKDK